MHTRALLTALGAVFILSGCATTPYAEVHHKRPRLIGPAGAEPLATVEQNMTRAMHEERAEPLVAMADCLVALHSASDELKRSPRNPTAIRDYNFGVSRVFQIIHDTNLDPWSRPLTVSSAQGEFVLTYKPDPRPEWNPALYQFTPADEFDVGGKYVTERTTRAGIGAPIVAVEREESKNARGKAAPSRIYRTVSAIAEFHGRQCVLEFYDPLDRESANFYGHTVPLAADFTVPLAVMLQETDPGKHELWRVLNPAKYDNTAKIERLQPFNPNKTVVLVIHGL